MLAFSIALVACVLYMGISMLVGEAFIFSRYSMYAKLTTRTEGALLYVRAGERYVTMDELDQVAGMDLTKIDPAGIPCSQTWLVHETRRWFESHQAAVVDGVPVEVGWRFLRVKEDGRVEESLRPLTRGRGRLRA